MTQHFALTTAEIELLHPALELAQSAHQLELRVCERVQDSMALLRDLVKP
jgi:hypothetical protein